MAGTADTAARRAKLFERAAREPITAGKIAAEHLA